MVLIRYLPRLPSSTSAGWVRFCSQMIESATVHVLADLLTNDNCALLTDEPRMALQIVRHFPHTNIESI